MVFSQRLMKKLRRQATQNFAPLRPFIEGNAVLDVGAAEGWTGELIKADDASRNVQLLDVTDLNQTDLPHTVYDGTTFPFADNSFDTSTLLLILHHCNDSGRVLDEAIRVTRKRLIITESVYHNPLGRALLFVADNAVNGLRSNGTMATGLKFKKPKTWEAIFKQKNLALRHKEWISRGFHKHILYVLDV